MEIIKIDNAEIREYTNKEEIKAALIPFVGEEGITNSSRVGNSFERLVKMVLIHHKDSALGPSPLFYYKWNGTDELEDIYYYSDSIGEWIFKRVERCVMDAFNDYYMMKRDDTCMESILKYVNEDGKLYTVDSEYQIKEYPFIGKPTIDCSRMPIVCINVRVDNEENKVYVSEINDDGTIDGCLGHLSYHLVFLSKKKAAAYCMRALADDIMKKKRYMKQERMNINFLMKQYKELQAIQ